jgi:hypothetical protein
MAIEEFGDCYWLHVETTIDAVIDDLRALGVDAIRWVVEWNRGLRDADRALMLAVAVTAVGVIIKILEKLLGPTAAVCFVGLLGGASWALLIRSFSECVDQLSPVRRRGVGDSRMAMVLAPLFPGRRDANKGGCLRVVFVGRARVADFALVSELPPETVEQFVVPFVAHAGAAALDEQDLPGPCHDDPFFTPL